MVVPRSKAHPVEKKERKRKRRKRKKKKKKKKKKEKVEKEREKEEGEDEEEEEEEEEEEKKIRLLKERFKNVVISFKCRRLRKKQRHGFSLLLLFRCFGHA